VQQDMGRVMLNLFNNAFYAVNQKQNSRPGLQTGSIGKDVNRKRAGHH
jgi:hypothetical protein